MTPMDCEGEKLEQNPFRVVDFHFVRFTLVPKKRESLLTIIRKQVWMGCECESLNGLL